MYQRYQPPQQDSKSTRFSNQNYRQINSAYNYSNVRYHQREYQNQYQHQHQREQQHHRLLPLQQQQNSLFNNYSIDDASHWKFRKFRSILNKITPETFDKLSKDILNVGLTSPQILRGVIHLIFDKAIRDSKFCALYARLCQVLCAEAPNYETQLGPNTFCKILISKCEAEFHQRRQASQTFDGKTELTEDEFEQKAVAKQNMLANIRFICELRKNDFIDESIIHECIRELLLKTRKPILDLSEDLECLCQIMRTIGSLLDVKASRSITNRYFDRMDLFSKKQELPSRIRFMLRDVIDLRNNNWRPRLFQREETNPQMISKIREDSCYQPSNNSLTLDKINRNLIGKNDLAKMQKSLILDDDEPSFTTSADYFGPGPALLSLDQPFSAFSSHKPTKNSHPGPMSTSANPPQLQQNVSSVSLKTMSGIKNIHSASNVEAVNSNDLNMRQSTSVPLNVVNSQNFNSIHDTRTRRIQAYPNSLEEDRLVINSYPIAKQSNDQAFQRPISNSNFGQSRTEPAYQHSRDRLDFRRERSGQWQPGPRDLARDNRQHLREGGRPPVVLQPFQQQVPVTMPPPPPSSKYEDRNSPILGIPVFPHVDSKRLVKPPYTSNIPDQRQLRFNNGNTNNNFNQNINFNTNHSSNNSPQFNRKSNLQHQNQEHLIEPPDNNSTHLNSDNNMNWRFNPNSVAPQQQPMSRYQELKQDNYSPRFDPASRISNKAPNFIPPLRTPNYRTSERNENIQHRPFNRDRNDYSHGREFNDRMQTNNDQINPSPSTPNVSHLKPHNPATFLSNTLKSNTTNISLRPSYNLINRNTTNSQQITPNRAPGSDFNSNKNRDNQVYSDTTKNSQDENSTSSTTTSNNAQTVKDRQKEIVINKFDVLLNELNQEDVDVILLASKIKELKIVRAYQPHCIINLIKLSIKKDDDERNKASRLLANLVPAIFEAASLLNAFKFIFKEMQALEVDTPKVKSHVAGFLSQAIADSLLTLQEVGETLDGGKYHPLFLLCLQKLEKLIGQTTVSEKFNASKINLMNMLPEADRTQERLVSILRDRCLGFMCPMLTIEPDLWSHMSEKDASPASIYRWIKDNVGQSLQSSPIFAHVFITCLLRYIVGQGHSNVTTTQDEQSSNNMPTEVEEKLTRYQPILQAILKEKSMQLAALYASQAYFHSINFPKGQLLKWFHSLYELNVVDEDVFLTWKEEINDKVPGKGQALFQVNTWLSWLAEAESEEDEEV